MATCEPKRCSAYSEDLRWRMVWQREVLDLKYEEIAKNLNVDASTVCRTVQLFHETGFVTKREYPKECLPRKLTEPVQLYILHLVLSKPGIYLHELQKQVFEVTGVELSESSICKFLHDSNFSRQTMTLRATQIDENLRARFVSDISVYSVDMIIFMDETGTDRRDMLRRKGYSLRGQPVVAHKLLIRGEHISVITFMSTAGVLDCIPVRGGVNAEKLYDVLQKSLLPHVIPFDGTSPHSVIILDNAAIHHVEEIERLLQGVGVLIHFLPPYSPDFNPIELLFSKVKTTIKTLEQQMERSDTETVVLAAFAEITQEDCCNWIKQSGIYNT